MPAPPAYANWVRPFVILASLGIVLALLYWAQAVLVPVALAILLTFLLSPVVTMLQRRGLWRIPAVIVVVTFTGLLLAGLSWLVASQFASLVDRYPAYEHNINQKIAALRAAGQDGFIDKIQAIIRRTTRELEKEEPSDSSLQPETPQIGPAALQTKAPPQPVKVVEDAEPFGLSQVWSALVPLLAPFASVALAVVLLIFMLIKREDLRDRLIGLVGQGRLTTTTKAIDEASERISRYLLMQFIINGSYGVAVSIGLFCIGVHYPLLWGFFAAVLRYIPYLGPWIAAVLPLGLSLLIFDTWTRPLLVVGLFLVLELWSNMFMEPWLYGRRIGVSEVGTLVMIAFWTWLWGPIGLILATPLTVCLVVMGRYVPFLKFFDTLLGDQPALEASASYYQRLLAGDQEEAEDLVEEHAKGEAPERIYDEILIPALLLARQDRKHGRLEADDEAFVIQATRDILEDLAARETASESKAAAADGAETDPPSEGPRRRLLILGRPAHHEAEELIVEMLGQLMRPAGFHVEAVGAKTLPTEFARRVEEDAAALAFVAVLPGGLSQARHLCYALRKRFSELPIVVGYWGRKEDFERVLVRLRQAGAGYLTTSLLQTRARITSLIEPPAAEAAAVDADAQEEPATVAHAG